MKIKERPRKKRRKVIRLVSGEIAEIDHNERTIRLPQLNKHYRLRGKYGYN